MIPAVRLVRRHLARRWGRTLLTIIGVAATMFLIASVESLSRGLERAITGGEAARTLIVYRQNRYCPQTSHLPERYVPRIEEIAGVESVLPIQVTLSNCRTSLDVVAFQGSPVERLLRIRDLEMVDGDLARFRRESGSALVGRAFAARRGLKPGDRFEFADIAVDVAGIFASEDPARENVILCHLESLQRSGPVNRLGTVTQIEVKVRDASEAPRIAEEIDRLFTAAEEPTDTRPKVAFLADATRDLREILRYGRLLGAVCAAVILVLVGNTLSMAVQERHGEYGVFLTLGFRAPHLVALVVLEALVLTGVGAGLGILTAFGVIELGHLSIGVEGVIVGFSVDPVVVAVALGVAAGAGLLAAVIPALHASRKAPVELLAGGSS
ncbi:MAG: ABC transporter permease [Planctomycetota bacterium]